LHKLLQFVKQGNGPVVHFSIQELTHFNEHSRSLLDLFKFLEQSSPDN